MNRQVVSLERLTQVTFPHEDITLVPSSTGLHLSRPPSLHESLHQHIRFTHSSNLDPAHATVLRRLHAIPAVRVTAAGGHRLAESTLARGTREGCLRSSSRGRPGADHVLQKRGSQVLQSLGRHCGRTSGVNLDGLPDAAALDQGIAVAKQLLVARSLLLEATLVQLDRQMVIAGGERLLGELRHGVPSLESQSPR